MAFSAFLTMAMDPYFFKTVTDSLFPEVVKEHDLSMSVANAILGLLRNPAFSLSDLTFRDAMEIDTTVSEGRRSVAIRRSESCTVGRCTL